jgi:RNA polymerase sigma-70 factor (ECF subfamily)
MGAEDVLERHRQFKEIQKHLHSLPVKYQEVLVLRFFESKKMSEISEILGKNENTIKSLIKRGTEKLRLSYSKSLDNVQPS